MCDSGGAERALQDTSNAYHGSLDAKGLYSHSATITSNEKAVLRPRQAQVSINFQYFLHSEINSAH